MDIMKPDVSEDLARDLVKRLYGLNVLSVKGMVSFDDQNFHIKVSPNHENPHIDAVSEDGYTLKVANTKKSSEKGYFEAMHTTMEHLRRHGIQSPLPLKNLNGMTWSLEKVPLRIEGGVVAGDKKCGVHVLSYIPGVPLSTVDITKDILYRWGVLLAKYHNSVKNYDNPVLLEKEVFWSLENIPKLEEYISAIPGEENRELILSVLRSFSTEIEPNLNHLPRGVLHGDFNENNVLVEKGIIESGKITYLVEGVLDFEDVHVGTYMWDVAVIMAYSLIVCDDEDVLAAPGYSLAGYLSFRPLNNLEVSLLKIGMECRLSQSLTLCAYSYKQDPNNTYLLTSAKTGWTKLRKSLETHNHDLLKKWKDIEISNS